MLYITTKTANFNSRFSCVRNSAFSSAFQRSQQMLQYAAISCHSLHAFRYVPVNTAGAILLCFVSLSVCVIIVRTHTYGAMAYLAVSRYRSGNKYSIINFDLISESQYMYQPSTCFTVTPASVHHVLSIVLSAN